MKTKYFFILIFLVIKISVNSQNCTNIEELLRKRHKISGMTYGHPHTTFDRHNGISLDSTIANIKKRIKDEKTNKYLNNKT